MNKKFLSSALAISLLGLCKIGFNNSVLASPPKDVTQIRNQIMRLNGEYKSAYLLGLISRSADPVENWRTKMLNLFNELSAEDRSRTFVQIVKIRSGNTVKIDDIVNYSEIVRIPCPQNREYPIELIDRFLTSGNQRPNYPRNVTSILAMKVSLNNDQIVIIAL